MMRYRHLLHTVLVCICSIQFATQFGWLNGAAIAQTPSQSCGIDTPCPVGSRSYHALLPDGWDGKSSLPVLLHFHGWGRQGDVVISHRRIAGATRKLGMLLLAPNGRRRSWNFWNSDTDDIAFASGVLTDAAHRWPIDTTRIFVSGYSYGSAMAWRFACAKGGQVNTLLGIAGTLHHADQTCATAVNIRHVHGTSDTVMPFPFAEHGAEHGNVRGAVGLWLSQNQCSANPAINLRGQGTTMLPLERYIWNQCKSGKSVVLDIHRRGHFIPRFWLESQLQDLL